MRKYLRDKYKDPNQRKYFSEKEKRFISAYKPPEVTIPKPHVAVPAASSTTGSPPN